MNQVENLFALKTGIVRFFSRTTATDRVLKPGEAVALMPGDIAAIQLHQYDERYQHLSTPANQVAMFSGAGTEVRVHSELLSGAQWVRVTPPGMGAALADRQRCLIRIVADFAFHHENGTPIIKRFTGYIGRTIADEDKLPGFKPYEHTIYGFPVDKQYNVLPHFKSASSANYCMQYIIQPKSEQEQLAEFKVFSDAIGMPASGLGSIDIRVVTVESILNAKGVYDD